MGKTYTRIGTAKCNQLGRDLYWSICHSNFDEILRWSGYNDAYWWNNVAPSEQFQIREHKGKFYKLDPETDQVFLVQDI